MEALNKREAIRNLQRYLRQLSYFNNEIGTAPIDGVFDTATKVALTDFQRDQGLIQSGVADQETFERLFAAYLNSVAEKAAPTPIYPFPRIPADYSVKEGDEFFLVELLQFVLKELETVYGEMREVEITGVFTPNTARAVKDFQRIWGLPQTGEVDRTTWNALADAYNREFDRYFEQ